MSKKVPYLQLLTIFLSACLAIAGQFLALPLMVYVFKPLTTVLILVLATGGPAGQPAPYRRWIVLGLLASLVGDVFLMLPGSWFIHGLVSFLVAHVLYLLALCSAGLAGGMEAAPGERASVRLGVRGLPFAVYGLISAALLMVLYPKLPTALVVPVLAYVVFLAGMAAQAGARHLVLKSPLTALAALGGAFFVCSDASLAFNKFHTPFAASPLVILSTYWVAQTLLALSVRRSRYHS